MGSLLAACRGGAQTADIAQSCSANVRERRILALPDGRRVLLSVTGAAWDGVDVATVGVRTRVETPRGGVAHNDSILGLVIGGNGETRAIPNPFVGQRRILSRVAPKTGGGWHFLVVTRSDTTDDLGVDAMYTDSATIWHGEADRAGTTNWKPIAFVAGARSRLVAEFASELATVGNDLAFAYAFGPDVRVTAMVLLRLRGGKWRADTVEHSDIGAYVRVTDDGAEWLVTNARFALRGFRFGDRWRPPEVLSESKTNGSFLTSHVVKTDNKVFVSWVEGGSEGRTSALWAADARSTQGRAEKLADRYEEPGANAVAAVSASSAVWLLANSERGGLDLVVFDGVRRRSAGFVSAPRGLRAFAGNASRNEVWWISDGLGETINRWSAFMRVRLACG